MSNKILSIGFIRKCNTSYGNYVLQVITLKDKKYIDINREKKVLTREVDNKLFFWRKRKALDYKKILTYYIGKNLTEDEYKILIDRG